MTIEIISTQNIKPLTKLALELWEGCSFEEEFENYTSVLSSENEICFLVKELGQYIAFIQLSIRNNYVEGAEELPVAYVEGVYVKPDYQKQGIGKKLIKIAEDWATQKGLKQLASDTDITNLPGINFHKQTGFTEAERIVCFIKNL